MKIQALQKLTLLDFPEKMACIVFTHGCNFRCPFCHNALLVTEEHSESVSAEEVYKFLKTRQGVLDGVVITGGEPLMWQDIDEFIKGIKDLGFLVKLDTNGSFPKKLKALCEAGLVDYVAMDIKNSPKKYAATIGKNLFDLSTINESIMYLKQGNVPYEFRTTVTKDFHTLDDLLDITSWISGCDAYYLQQFVDSGNLIDDTCKGYSNEEFTSMYKAVKRVLPCTKTRGV